MSYQIQIDTTRFKAVMLHLAKSLKKDTEQETMRQAKFLCIQLAKSAPPVPRGSKGLEANIPKKKRESVLKGMKKVTKSVQGMSLMKIAAYNDSSVFWNSLSKKTEPNKESIRFTKTATGALMFATSGNESPLWRITKAAQTDPTRALKNLRQVLKNYQVEAPKIYGKFANSGLALQAYYQNLNKKSKKQSYDTVFINTKAKGLEEERMELLARIEPSIGTVKAGWIQAGLQIPVKAGPRIPSWLLNKKAIANSTTNMSNGVVSISLTNNKGNAKGINDRLGYTAKAIRARTRKMINNIREAIKATMRKKYTSQNQPVPAHLAAGKKDDSIE